MKQQYNNNPLISIIVTTFNRKEYLKETINSILNQTYKNFEVIVIDNYSDYDFNSFLNSFNCTQVKGLRNNNNGIIAKNRNIGIDNARGEYIAFCDDDDIWHEDKLQIQLSYLLKNNYKFCFTEFENIDEQGFRIMPDPFFKNWHKELSFTKFVLSNGCICYSSVMIKRELIKDVGLFDEDPLLVAYEDYNYWARILNKFNGIRVDQKLVKYRINKERIKCTTKVERYSKERYVLNSIAKKNNVSKFVYMLKMIKLAIKYSLAIQRD